jgi:hypothetical protein
MRVSLRWRPCNYEGSLVEYRDISAVVSSMDLTLIGVHSRLMVVRFEMAERIFYARIYLFRDGLMLWDHMALGGFDTRAKNFRLGILRNRFWVLSFFGFFL